MRVALFVHHALTSAPGGIGVYVRRLASEMARIAPAVDFRLICFRGQTPHDGWLLPPNASFIELPFSSRLAGNLMWYPFGGPQIERWIGSNDILHLTDTEWPVPSQTPIVATVHDLFPEHFPDRYKRLARWRRGRSLAQIKRDALRIIAVSEHTRQEALRYLGIPEERVVCIHPGAPDGETARPAEQAVKETLSRCGIRTPYFLFVGRQDLRKNLDTLLRAFDQVRRGTTPTPMLVLVGSQAWRFHRLRHLCRELDLESTVRFTGYLPASEVSNLLAGALALVYPSLTEGFGFPPLEAMAAGVPVIASNAGSIPEVVGDAALLFDPRDENRLSELMFQLLGNPGTCGALVLRGRERLKQFSWSRTAERTLELYRQVLLSKRPGVASDRSKDRAAP